MIAQARGGQTPLSVKPFLVPDNSIAWPPFLFPAAISLPKDSADTKEKKTKVERQIVPHESDSDSSNSEESSPSSSSEVLAIEPTAFILNRFTRIAHIAKYLDDNPTPSPACGRDLGISVELLQVVESVPGDYELCQHKACSFDR